MEQQVEHNCLSAEDESGKVRTEANWICVFVYPTEAPDPSPPALGPITKTPAMVSGWVQPVGGTSRRPEGVGAPWSSPD